MILGGGTHSHRNITFQYHHQEVIQNGSAEAMDSHGTRTADLRLCRM